MVRATWAVLPYPVYSRRPPDDEYWRAMAWYVHHYSAWVLADLLALHAAAALWHELVLRDRLIRRRMI